MTLRLLIAIFGICLGLMTLFATDLTWSLVEYMNALFGKQVRRTERWNARASFAGIILICAGVLMLAVVWLRR
jgi:sterol desaturase/sphingolipid hydroxylase (fatty acid hydroxylase superfamily)